jgi:hypothetical protein
MSGARLKFANRRGIKLYVYPLLHCILFDKVGEIGLEPTKNLFLRMPSVLKINSHRKNMVAIKYQQNSADIIVGGK